MIRLKTCTIAGAMASAGRKLPTGIFFNSSMLLMPIPISKIPPVAVISALNSYTFRILELNIKDAEHFA